MINKIFQNNKEENGSETINSYPTLVLICKRPAIGFGKQRLAQSIGKEQALSIANSLLACALEDLYHWPGEVVISPSHAADYDWAVALLERPVTVIAQREGNLGERINQLDSSLRSAGYIQTIYIGSDAPILGGKEYQEIVKALTISDIALCPAFDGGVTIMANRQPWPDLCSLGWSTASLGGQLASLCRSHNLKVQITKSSYDLDNIHQLAKLARDLLHDSREARQQLLQEINQLTRPDK